MRLNDGRANETKMRPRRPGTARNRPALPGTPINHKSEDLAPHWAFPGIARKAEECARRESNPRPSA